MEGTVANTVLYPNEIIKYVFFLHILFQFNYDILFDSMLKDLSSESQS
jgi:hypothetical protein